MAPVHLDVVDAPLRETQCIAELVTEACRQVLAWLRESPAPLALEDLNRRVYAELFLTPRSDPWLGLVPEATYTALTDDGFCAAAPR